MNEFLGLLDLQSWKPVLTALLLPPVPLLLLTLMGARMLAGGRRIGWLLVWPSLITLWLGSTVGAAQALAQSAGLQTQALSQARLQAVAAAAQAGPPGRPRIAIVVLGGGREVWAPEYGGASLGPESMQRLRYGLWLAHATGAPVAFSGGSGWAQKSGLAEADIAARIAEQENGLPLRWIENTSRDTRENARNTVPLLRADGIEQLLLVTHGWHMRRAMRAFEAEAGGRMKIEAAPMGLAESDDSVLLEWLPSGRGAARFREVLREWLGFKLGA